MGQLTTIKLSDIKKNTNLFNGDFYLGTEDRDGDVSVIEVPYGYRPTLADMNPPYPSPSYIEGCIDGILEAVADDSVKGPIVVFVENDGKGCTVDQIYSWMIDCLQQRSKFTVAKPMFMEKNIIRAMTEAMGTFIMRLDNDPDRWLHDTNEDTVDSKVFDIFIESVIDLDAQPIVFMPVKKLSEDILIWLNKHDIKSWWISNTEVTRDELVEYLRITAVKHVQFVFDLVEAQIEKGSFSFNELKLLCRLANNSKTVQDMIDNLGLFFNLSDEVIPKA